MTNRTVLLASNYNVWREPFNGQSHSMLDVIKDVEQADLLVPGGADYMAGQGVRPSLGYLLGETHHRLLSAARARFGAATLTNMKSTTIDQYYDLFFYVCQFPQELSALRSMHGWRRNCGKAVCYVLETWSATLPSMAANLRLLDQFDHVFVLNTESIPMLKRYTSTPISHLATAADCLKAHPGTRSPARSIDVYSFGRRSDAVHRQLLAHAGKAPDFSYVYDAIKGGTICDWSEHRALTSSQMKRTRYFMAFNPPDVGGGCAAGPRAEQALSTRYFEGAAGGAVMLGTKPPILEFDENFNWEDALIEILPDGDALKIIEQLDSQPERLARASRRNVVESLSRHDWAHRWRTILSVIGEAETPALTERIDALKALAVNELA